jgi:hypothetical protein
MHVKNCPNCQAEIEFSSKDALNNSIRKNSNCKLCSVKFAAEKTKGKKLSDEHKQKLSIAKKGKKLSDEHKKNIGIAGIGRKPSNETKEKIAISKMGDKNPAKRQDVKNKIRNTVNKLYQENPEYKEKISKSLLKYFSENKNNLEELTAFQEYRRIVDNLTSRNKKKLFENWSGYDYYDDEYIKDNFKLHFNNINYPSIDHKISVYVGFKEGINPENIGDINNLCITKRTLNSKKSIMGEMKFKESLN